MIDKKATSVVSFHPNIELRTNLVSDKISVEVDLNKILKVYLVPNELPDSTGLCVEWLRKQEEVGVMPRGGGGMYGPPDNMNQKHRVGTKIGGFAHKCQIPLEHPGVLIITGHFFFGDTDRVECFVNGIIEKIYELRNIQAVVLVSGKIIGDDGKTTITDREDFVFIHNNVCDYVWEDVVIVKNQFCRFDIDYGHLASLLATK